MHFDKNFQIRRKWKCERRRHRDLASIFSPSSSPSGFQNTNTHTFDCTINIYIVFIQSFKSKWDSGAGPPDPNLDTLPREPRLRWVDFYFLFWKTLRGDLVPDMVRHWWDCDAVWGVVRLVLRRGCLHVMGFKGLPVLPVPVQGTPGQLLWRKSRKSPQWIWSSWILQLWKGNKANHMKSHSKMTAFSERSQKETQLGRIGAYLWITLTRAFLWKNVPLHQERSELGTGGWSQKWENSATTSLWCL